MEKKRKQPQKLPHPLPTKPGIVEPFYAVGEMHCPSKKGIISDPDGSYTGRPLDGGKPVQDVDDL